MTARTSTVDLDAASTPRLSKHRSWLRRHPFAITGVAIVAAVLLLRLIWGWHTARQLEAAIEAIRRKGHPTVPAALNEFSVYTGNAWPAYARATAALRRGVSSPRESALEYPSYPPYGPEWEALAAASETANATALTMARRARAPVRPQTSLPGPNSNYSFAANWTGARRLANVLSDGAQYAHLRGDDAESVERLLDILDLSRSIREDSTVVSQLVGIGLDALACHAIQQIIPTLKLDTSAGGKPASREQARALMAALLDEERPREWVARAIRRERVHFLQTMQAQAAGTWAVRPLADRSTLRWLRDVELVVEAAEGPYAPAARRRLREILGDQQPQTQAAPFFGRPWRASTIPRYSRWFDDARAGGLDLAQTVEQFYRAFAERRATAVVVAARLYRQDNGRWPDDAAALVPKYLDVLPVDPFGDDGQPIGYVIERGVLPDGGDRPLVYFELGPSRDGLIDTEPMYGWQVDRQRKFGGPRREIRQYRDVSYWTPTTRRFEQEQQSAAEAVDDDPDEADAPGKDKAKDGDADRPPKQ